MLEEIELKLTSKIANEVRRLKECGMEEVREFISRYNTSRSSRRPMDVGIDDAMKLKLRSSEVRDVMSPIVVGMVPVMQLS